MLRGVRRPVAPVPLLRPDHALRLTYAISLFMVLSLTALVATDAHAKPRPALSWSLAKGVREGAPIGFTWSTSHLGDARLVIQHPVGTSRTWKTMTTLKTRSGSGELPGVPLGKYRYRLAALKGKRVLAQQVVGASVFGEVPFSVLLGNANIQVATTPSYSFPYVDYWEGAYNGERVFSAQRNNCIFVHVAFLLTVGEGYSGKLTAGTITLVQETRQPTAITAPFNTIGSLDAQVTPGQTWAVNGQHTENVHFNGYAVCNSTEPILQG